MIIETRQRKHLDAVVPMTCPDCKQEHWILADLATVRPPCGDCIIKRWKEAFGCGAQSADS